MTVPILVVTLHLSAPTLRVGFDGGCKAVAEQSFLVEFGAFLWTDNYYRTTREMGS